MRLPGVEPLCSEACYHQPTEACYTCTHSDRRPLLLCDKPGAKDTTSRTRGRSHATNPNLLWQEKYFNITPPSFRLWVLEGVHAAGPVFFGTCYHLEAKSTHVLLAVTTG